jgi:outer membrane protein assembly factor BamB
MGNLSALLGYAVLLGFGASLQAEDWPGWRGPRGDGNSGETNIPVHWNAKENIAWKVQIPGKGHSSPVVWGDRIFVTTCIEHQQKRLLICLNRRTGKEVWNKLVVTAKLEPKHDLNSYASATPATDGKHVYVAFHDEPNVLVAAYDFDGKEIWQKSPGQFFSKHGWSSSPVLYNNLLILNCDQDSDAYIVALDKATGEEKWRTDRPNKTRSYCVPLLVDAAGKKQLVLSGSKCVAGYNPDTGKQYWIIDGPTEQFVASPVFAEGVLFVTGGFPDHHLLGIKPDGVGNITNTHILWRDTKGVSYVPSPIALGKYFYIVSDDGMASCLDAKTGKREWMHRLGKHHRPSAVSAEGRLYFLDDDGTTWVLKAGAKFEIMGKNPLDEPCSASPAIAHGHLYIRGLQNLYSIGAAEKPGE